MKMREKGEICRKGKRSQLKGTLPALCADLYKLDHEKSENPDHTG